ncbi:MAG: methyltransferase [Zavarzinella sp.]
MFDVQHLLETVYPKIQPPIIIVGGSPRVAAECALVVADFPTVCFQMDVHQAERLERELAEVGLSTEVRVTADIWDLPNHFQTAIVPIQSHGERELKLDLMEQTYHVLQPKGLCITVSEYTKDSLLPKVHKKLYGKCSEAPANKKGSIFWSVRTDDRPRRRHEMTFRARIGDIPSREFVSRPGVFCYGSFDDGARALLECADIRPNETILDLGCGVGAVGILAAERTGLDAPITFVDSNARAIALTELNAKANGLTNYTTILSARMADLEEGHFDVILANPPYYAASSIAELFVRKSKALLKSGGRFYLVTKQVNTLAPLVMEAFGDAIVMETRGYHVIQGDRIMESER